MRGHVALIEMDELLAPHVCAQHGLGIAYSVSGHFSIAFRSWSTMVSFMLMPRNRDATLALSHAHDESS